MDFFSLTINYVDQLQGTYLGFFLYIPLALIVLDVITGVLAALKQGVFSWKQLKTFLLSNVASYLVIVATVFALYCYSGSVVAVQWSLSLGMLAHGGSMLGSIIENMKELGVPTPIVQEVQQMATPYFQDYPPILKAAPVIPPAPVFMPAPIEKQATQVQPIIAPDVVRVSTPPPVPVSPVEIVPPLAILPTGL